MYQQCGWCGYGSVFIPIGKICFNWLGIKGQTDMHRNKITIDFCCWKLLLQTIMQKHYSRLPCKASRVFQLFTCIFFLCVCDYGHLSNLGISEYFCAWSKFCSHSSYDSWASGQYIIHSMPLPVGGIYIES